MSRLAKRRLVLLPGGGEGPATGARPRRPASLSVIDGLAEPPPAPEPATLALPEDRIAAARRFRRELEARIARPLEDLLRRELGPWPPARSLTPGGVP